MPGMRHAVRSKGLQRLLFLGRAGWYIGLRHMPASAKAARRSRCAGQGPAGRSPQSVSRVVNVCCVSFTMSPPSTLLSRMSLKVALRCSPNAAWSSSATARYSASASARLLPVGYTSSCLQWRAGEHGARGKEPWVRAGPPLADTPQPRWAALPPNSLQPAPSLPSPGIAANLKGL